MKIKILLALIMLWCTYVMTVQSETAPPVGANAETDCTAITTGTGGGASGSGSGSGSGTHSSDH